MILDTRMVSKTNDTDPTLIRTLPKSICVLSLKPRVHTLLLSKVKFSS